MMDSIHEMFLRGRRARILSEHVAARLPEGASVLDVGCGDGEIAQRIMALRPDVTVRGIDVLLRPSTAIPVDLFDGSHFPHGDESFDVVMFVDVLHHTDNQTVLLREAARVARQGVVVKDHLLHGWLAESTLRFMDSVGNTRHGVVLPYNYSTKAEWDAAFEAARLAVTRWDDRMGIYVWPASLVFDRKLHFVATLHSVQDRPNGT